MWKGPNEDPGPPTGGSGSDPDTSSHPQLADLRDENEQQQLLITHLKEIIRKNEHTSVTAEKVEEFANTLAKAKRNKLKRETAGITEYSQDTGMKNEKVLLMKRQLEENKAKLAARDKCQKGIEDMVVQMKAQFDDSQNLMSQSVSSINLSLGDTTLTSSTEPLTSQNKDNSIVNLYSKIKQLEAQILDLHENLKEKDSVIDARTKAITLMSENLSKKGKTTLDALDDTKEQMRHMQNAFVETEEKLKSDKQKLLQQIYEKDEQIANFKQSTEELAQINIELTKLNDGLQERLNARDDKSTQEYEKNILELKEKIKELEDCNKASPSKSGRRNRKSSKQRTYEPNQNTEMEAKITFQQSIITDKQIEIENQQEMITNLESSIQKLKTTIIDVKGRKTSVSDNERDVYENQIKELKQCIEELNQKSEHTNKLEERRNKNQELEEIDDAQEHKTEKVANLEKEIHRLSSQVEIIRPLQIELDELKSRVKVLQLEKQALEYSDINACSVDIEEVNKLKKQLDENNKSTIKLRAQHKAQIKDLRRQLDEFKRNNADGCEMEKIQEENAKLLLKVAELQEEIDNVQLKMIESADSNTDFTFGKNTTEYDVGVKTRKIEELENDLIEHKYQIDVLNMKLETLSKFENAKVSSDLNLIQLEEQLEATEREKSRLLEEQNELLTRQTELQNKLDSTEGEKRELDTKIQSLAQENMDLLNRLEKLSTEKVSSAESIEIVDGLTNQEKLEIEAYQKTLEKQKSEDNLSVGTPELNESVNQLTEETTELLQRIELFTEERREVMEKLEQLATENNHLNIKLNEAEEEMESLRADKEYIEKNIFELTQNQIIIETKYNSLKDQGQYFKKYLSLAINGEEASVDLKENMSEEFSDFEYYHKLIVDRKLELNNLQSDLSNSNLVVANIKRELETLLQHHQELNGRYEIICQEVDEFSDERQSLFKKIDDLEINLSDKSENYNRIVKDLKIKCISLQEELELKSVISEEPLKVRLAEVDAKNKELREKLKMIAANLKKKSAAFNEAVKNNEQTKEKWEFESQEKDNQIKTLTVRLQEINELLLTSTSSELFESVKGDLQEVNLTNTAMQIQLNDLLNLKSEHENQIHLLTREIQLVQSNANNDFNLEISTRDETIAILRLEMEQLKEDMNISVNTHQMKMKELEMFIESQDRELNKHKVKVERLEEGLAMVEERRSSLERKAVELGSKLQEREMIYEEAIVNEDNLACRLRVLAEHDVAIEKELSASAEENKSLTKQNNELFSENADLRSRLDSVNYKLTEALGRIENLGTLEVENEHLNQSVKKLEIDLTKLDKEYQNLQRKQKSENEQSEIELQDQITAFNEGRKSLTEKCEMLEEQLKEYQEHIDSLNGTISDISIKLQEQELLISHHNEEMQLLQAHIIEMENKCHLFENEGQTKSNNFLKLNSDLEEKELKISDLEYKLKITKDELDENSSQLNFAKNMMNQIEESNLQVLGKNYELEKKIYELEAETLKMRVNTTNKHEIISTPVHTSVLFGSPIDDPFAFVSPTQSSHVTDITRIVEDPPENTELDLKNKIRTLEFMLYNLEQEKNDLSNQCEKLTDEIAKLVYEREASKVNLPQIIAQIVPDSEAQITNEDNREIIKSLFTSTSSKNTQAEDSVDLGIQAVEELINAKSAYICSDKEQSTRSETGVFGENDDGWGFVVDEPRLTEDEQPIQQNQFNNQALLNQISVLELEREKHLADLRQSQIKSGKLLKKLKEFKAKNDELAAKLVKKDDGFGDLELAIQDELKSQVEMLEKRLKEIQYEVDKEKKENSALLTKNNVIASANERMVEMKEKQDIEMAGWQQKNRELISKLDQFEWGSDELSPSKQIITTVSSTSSTEASELHMQIQDLNHTIKDLTLDNEELQTMLEEQRELRITIDRQKSLEISTCDIKATSEYLALLIDKKTIEEERGKLAQMNADYSDEIEKLSHQLQKVNIEKAAFEEELNKITQTYTICNNEKLTIIDELDELIQKHNQCKEKTVALTIAAEQYKISILGLEANIQHLEQTQCLTKENTTTDIEESLLKQKEQFIQMESILNASIAALENDNATLTKTLEGMQTDIKNLNETVNIISAEKLELQQKLLETVSDSNRLVTLQESIQQKQILIDDYEHHFKNNEGELEMKLTSAIEQITLEWQARVDQRGNDVAESWKLHVESKENEFMNLEQQLRREINDLDQKCIGLVNENNELRKSVDAEIRNEVDQVSVLQQQINDKQLCINELQRVMDEKQVELNQLHNQVLENEATIQQLNIILQEKDVMMVNFEKEIKTRELDTEDKQNSINELNKQLDLNEVGESNKDLEIKKCKIIINDLRQDIITQQQLNDKLSTDVNELNNQLSRQHQEIVEACSEKDMIASFLDEINSKRETETHILAELNKKVEQYQYELAQNLKEANDKDTIIFNMNSQIQYQNDALAEMTNEKQWLINNTQVVNKSEELISELNRTIQEKEEEVLYLNESRELENSKLISQHRTEVETMKNNLLEVHTKYDELLVSKEEALQIVYGQLADSQNKSTMDEQIFHEKDDELNDLLQKDHEHEALHEYEHRQLEEMREIIEKQVLRIEELKLQVYEKSASYDALFAQVEMQQSDPEQPESKVEKHVKFATAPIADDLSEPVSRAELDLALYMLHQRDVRCEELTLELMQLLEERDTLQLRLSNAIREKEVIRDQQRLSNEKEQDISSDVVTGTIPKTKTITLGATNTEITAEATETDVGEKSLNTKLSELKTVGYRRDKTLLDEQDYRRMQQMSIMNQHFDEASKLPAEAAARLVDANYTLSRDVQSPSKVLLNWLWGRSTPKVNNI